LSNKNLEKVMTKVCDGKVAIVTGAARGVGREHALLLAKHGAKVVVNDLGAAVDGSGADVSHAQKVVDEIVAGGGEAVVNGDDVGSFDGAKNMVDQAINTFGSLDILVNNAGILRDRMLVNMTEEEWDSVINVHLKGTFAPTRHAAAYWRAMSKQTGGKVYGRVINTSSTSGIYGNVGQTNYGAAKAGIAAFTVIAARELGRFGVTVNAIAPSAYTRMTDNLREYTEEDIAQRDPKWVSPCVVYLAGADAGDITGRVLQAGSGIVAVCEGWRRGAEVETMADVSALGEKIREMVGNVRKNVGMDGFELD
jgi:NAD(P)-dependent dehydrogenase (short-subunit alcohol dehydrogenase family)